jgi:hypothetical protein
MVRTRILDVYPRILLDTVSVQNEFLAVRVVAAAHRHIMLSHLPVESYGAELVIVHTLVPSIDARSAPFGSSSFRRLSTAVAEAVDVHVFEQRTVRRETRGEDGDADLDHGPEVQT